MTDYEATLNPALREKGINLNISAYRLLYIYLLLSQSRQLCFADLNTHLLNHPLVQRAFSNETLNKYLNTLQLFGCSIHRYEEQGHYRYRLDEHPLKPELSPIELKALGTISELLSRQPLTSAYKNFCLLIRRLSIIPALPDTGSLSGFETRLESGITEEDYDLAEHFRKYCFEGQVLEICYETEDNSIILLFLEPSEVAYHKKRLYLVGNCPKTNSKVRYEIDRIRSHRQLPSRIRLQSCKTTVTFKLTGRAACNYRTYPGEIAWTKGEFLLVKHKTDDVEQLLKRLLKYGPQCQIISPDSARQSMCSMIEQLLKTIEEPIEGLITHLTSTEQTDETLRKWVCYLDNRQTSDDEAVD